MTPGPHLDKLIAELMGWTEVTIVELAHSSIPSVQGFRPGEVPSAHTGYRPRFNVPRYSTDISAAWTVIEKIKTQNRSIEVFSPQGDPHWVCQITQNGELLAGVGEETAPLVICLAALKVVGLELENPDKTK